MPKPSFEDRKRAIDEQRAHRERDLKRSGVSDREAEHRARREIDETVRRLQNEKDW